MISTHSHVNSYVHSLARSPSEPGRKTQNALAMIRDSDK